MRFLIYSFFVFLLVSCKTYQPNLSFKKDTFKAQNTYFSNPENEFVYKTNIEVFGKNVTGLLVVKPLQNHEHRVLLTTEFGNTLLDLTLSKDSFVKNYAIPDLDRKIILNMLYHDFKIMMQPVWLSEYAHLSTDLNVYKASDKGKNYFLFYQNAQLNKIVYSKSKPKVEVLYKNIDENIANEIIIQHYNYNIKITLNKLDF